MSLLPIARSREREWVALVADDVLDAAGLEVDDAGLAVAEAAVQDFVGRDHAFASSRRASA